MVETVLQGWVGTVEMALLGRVVMACAALHGCEVGE